MHLTPRPHFRPLSALFLALALGCTGAPMEPTEAESTFASETRALSLPPGLRPSLVKDLQVGPHTTGSTVDKGSYWTPSWQEPPLAPVVIGSTAYFAAKDEAMGLEIWRTDGTREGTRLLRELIAGPNLRGISGFVAVGDTLYVSTETGPDTGLLWKSDGTAAGTQRLALPAGVRAPGNIASCNGTLFFQNIGPDMRATYGTGLWASDGTPAGTVQLSSSLLVRKTSPTHITCANGTLFFLAQAVAAPYGHELWKSDGTPAGTVRLGNIGSVLTFGEPVLVAAGSRVFVNTNNPSTFALWTSDGTPVGTRPVDGFDTTTRYSSLTVVGDTVSFVAAQGMNKPALWVSDGTPAGTRRLMESFGVMFAKYQAMGNTLLFSMNARLYRSDGTPEGTVLVPQHDLDLMPQSAAGAVLPDGRWLLSGLEVSLAPPRVWVSDGTAAGRTLLQSSTGQVPINALQLTRLGDRVLFWANDGLHGLEPWVTDGTPAGTRMVRDIFRADGSWPSSLTDVDGTLYFTANTPRGRDLWKSDGSAEGTTLVRDLGFAPELLTSAEGTLFFIENLWVPSAPGALWKSDGTEGGTVPVYALPSGSRPSSSEVGTLGTLFFFANTTSAHGRELWKSDGTAEGTVLVQDVRAGSASSTPSNLVDVNGTLFFFADDGVHGRELWKTDGTAEGTVLVADIAQGSGSSLFSSPQPAVANGTLYFEANDGIHGSELWKTDGTAEGTVLVKDTVAGPESGLMNMPLAAVGSRGVAFPAVNDLGSLVLWKSDGTTEGTHPVDAHPVSPMGFKVSGSRLFFIADDGEHGMELWSLKQGAVQQRR